jgi:methylenetetrahydrofolate dehydrogenase (NADP+)/methenyltetrahydrofolate cyclohydrolase
MIFDGKAFARQIEEKIKNKVTNLVKKPRVVSILVGDDPASQLYTRLKQQAAERVGIEFEVAHITKDALVDQITQISGNYDGVMIQLPIPGFDDSELRAIIAAIPLEKDVDGLRWEESSIVPATVRGVLSLVDEIAQGKTKFAVLGSAGAVGRPLVHFLRSHEYQVSEIEWNTQNPTELTLAAEVVISCVGKANLISSDMIRDTTIVIDVGMSELDGKIVGDMTQEVYQKASIAVPVPGGVGPVTIASLMANAIDLWRKTNK